MCVYVCVCVCACVSFGNCVTFVLRRIIYWVATISRLLKITGLFILAEYRLFYRNLLQKRPIILRSLLIVATP